MADTANPFATELELRSQAPASGNPFAAELTAREQPAQEPARVPGMHQGALDIARWVAQNPQAAADMIAQMVGSGAGIAIGTATGPAAPVAAPVLGALGSVGGKKLSRYLGGAEQPDAVETALDAVAGGVAPAVSAVAKPAVRAFTGVTDDIAQRATRVGENAFGKAIWPSGSVPYAEAAAEKASGKAARELVQKNVNLAEAGALASKGGQLGALAQIMATGDLGSAAMWLAGGSAAGAAQRKAAEKLLRSKTVVQWITSPTSTDGLKTRAATLGALAAEKFLTADERAAVQQLAEAEAEPERSPPRATTPPKPLGDRRPKPLRDASSGRFTSPDDARALAILRQGGDLGGPKHGDVL